MNIPPVDSVKKRYIFSLAVNILLCIPRLLNASLVPRSLGPAAYGDYQFLINNFLSIKNFLDLGTSTAFFTYNAKNDDASNLNIQYLLWWGVQLILIISFVLIAYFIGIYTYIWPAQNFENIILAAFAVWLFLFAQQLVQFGDSKGLTILCQKTNLFANYSAAALLAFMYFQGLLTIKTAMLIYITGPIILIFFLMIKLYKKFFAATQPLLKDFSKNYSYFKNYCAPLVTVTVVGFLADFLDRWMLQKFAGSAAQGYYSLSYNWAAITLIFFNPMLNIFWREVAVEASNKNNEKVAHLFDKFTKTAFFLTSFISFFLAFNAHNLIPIIAGKNFDDAKLSFIIMIFYPIAQVNGQLIGCLFFALEDIKKYRNYSIVIMTFSTLLTYFIIAPKNFIIPGLGSNHSLFALKILVAGLIGSDILVYKMSQKLKFNYLSLIVYRIKVVLFFLFICLITHFVLNSIHNVFLLTFLWILSYNMMTMLSVFTFSNFFGFNDIKFAFNNLYN